MRSTKIVCTIGPACSSPEMVERLTNGGMDIARINLSHGTREDAKNILDIIRNLNAEKGLSLATMFDTRGAEIRTAEIPRPINVEKGEEVVFSSHPISGESRQIVQVSYDRFYADVPETDCIIIDNGALIFDIVEIRPDKTVIAKAQDAGTIGSRRHINLPGADIDLPSITDDDWKDIDFAIKESVDFIALSFVRTIEDVNSVRKKLSKEESDMHIVAKVETRLAVDNVDGIIEASDAIMIARGDLGTDIPFEELPALQDEMASRCRNRGTPVIIATHMLDSMTEYPMPTRAEVTDVAHAVMTLVDATMLSGETACGRFPYRSLNAMDRILRETEKHPSRLSHDENIPIHNEREARAEEASSLSSTSKASAIIAFTHTGKTAKEVSKFRPHVPIVAFTDNASTQRKLHLPYGVHPLLIPFSAPDETIDRAIKAAIEAGFVKKKESVVLIADTEDEDTPVEGVQVKKV